MGRHYRILTSNQNSILRYDTIRYDRRV